MTKAHYRSTSLGKTEILNKILANQIQQKVVTHHDRVALCQERRVSLMLGEKIYQRSTSLPKKYSYPDGSIGIKTI